jgi:uncharacterized membrane protein
MLLTRKTEAGSSKNSRRASMSSQSGQFHLNLNVITYHVGALQQVIDVDCIGWFPGAHTFIKVAMAVLYVLSSHLHDKKCILRRPLCKSNP